MNSEQMKDNLKAKLIDHGYFKTPEGKQLYELTYQELEDIYKQIKGEI